MAQRGYTWTLWMWRCGYLGWRSMTLRHLHYVAWSYVAAVRGGLDTTRTQQQEREQQQEQMKEREQEEEEMAQFCRDDEQPLPWESKLLSKSPNTTAAEAAVVAKTDSGHPFPFLQACAHIWCVWQVGLCTSHVLSIMLYYIVYHVLST